ncbi:EAL domain-containing protein [Alteromonas sp. 1_MG-2023]|uniref:putative bifunctional diguanylate cyclase/phosphodiesterase n=1 Tax=Alteromonas sp. 1_MG-2023 TaxID=3062669 RepID=UPI0026E492B2|nr:GGDEF domain-containing phosphodiesterase [Alteromonas sp. 1_MG-2023]MDO6474175.1 EAL domain-containing protein [Alteromonas sp. 1_MG-2023]
MMRSLSLRHSLFRILLGSTVLTAGLILLSVWNATDDLVQQNLEKELAIDTNILQHIVEERTKALYASTKALSTAYEFRAAFASYDPPTINSALQTMDARQDFDFLVMLNLQDETITSFPDDILVSGDRSFGERYRNIDPGEITRDYVFMNDTLYHAVVAPVAAPRVIGYLGAAFALDDNFLALLSEVVQAEVIITSGDNSARVLNSSLPHDFAARLIERSDREINWFRIMAQDESLYEVRELELPGIDHIPVKILIALDVSEQYLSVLDLQTVVIIIALGIIVLSLAISMVLAKRVSTPVNQLVTAVNEIAEGHYQEPVKSDDRVSEIGELARAFNTMQARIRSREDHILFQAQHDMLSGLYNRHFVEEKLNQRLDAGETLQILGINIMGIRTINDLYGYTTGDFCIKTMAQRTLSWPGMAARLAGGDFLFVPDVPLDETAIDAFRQQLEAPVEFDGLVIPMKVFFAHLSCPSDGDTTEEVFRKINILSDESKQHDHWLIAFKEEMQTKYLRRLTIITELKKVLTGDQTELSMVYQPKVHLQTNRVCSVEALIRWNSASLGFVPPDEFIGIAEQAGLIEQVTTWVLDRTLDDLAGFRQQGYVFSVAINLSTQDIQRPELMQSLAEKIAAKGLTPSDVELEITESDLVEDAALAIRNLNTLKAMGFHFAIDDFGTGYSSLAYLKTLPVQTIKIDKSFVLKLASDDSDQQIVRTVLNLAAVFHLCVVAEGVEDERSLQILKDGGCDIAQGYFISRPLTVPAMYEWLGSTHYGIQRTETT